MSVTLRAVLALVIALCAGIPAWSAPARCAKALGAGTVCEAANAEARQLLKQRNLSGAIVVQDVETGAVIVLGSYARRDDRAAPPLTPAATILPLSASKLFLAASWWTHADEFDAADKRLYGTIVRSADEDGRQLALALRKSVGTAVVLDDLARYGFARCEADQASREDRSFWLGDVPKGLVPGKACTTLNDQTDDATWASAFSLGEANFSMSLLHVSRFMQAIGNNGVQVAPQYLTSGAADGQRREARGGSPIMPSPVAAQLRAAMRQVVEKGTARGVQGRVLGGWTLGGKTGTGPGGADPADGIFVGLFFDPLGKARYTVAICVARGGKGGGAAAEIASDLFNYVLGLQDCSRCDAETGIH